MKTKSSFLYNKIDYSFLCLAEMIQIELMFMFIRG